MRDLERDFDLGVLSMDLLLVLDLERAWDLGVLSIEVFLLLVGVFCFDLKGDLVLSCSWSFCDARFLLKVDPKFET